MLSTSCAAVLVTRLVWVADSSPPESGKACGRKATMAKLILSPEDAELYELVGSRAFFRAREVLADIVEPAVGRSGQAIGRVRDVAEVPSAQQPAEPGLGLQFEVVNAYLPRSRKTGQRISLRPVLPGRNGWVRSGISWHSLGYVGGRSPNLEHHRRLLTEVAHLSSTNSYYYGGSSGKIFLDDFGSRRIWDLLAEAQESGLPLVQPGKNARPVVVARHPARVSIRVDRVDDELLLEGVVQDDGMPVDLESALFIGEPAHGIVSWDRRGTAGPVMRLAPLARSLPISARKALTAPNIRIPGEQEGRFFAEFYPGLVRQIDVAAAGPTVSLPEVGAPTLTVTLSPESHHRLGVSWEWVVEVGGGRHGEPLWSPALSDERVDLLQRVADLVAPRLPGLLESGPLGRRVAADSVLSGDLLIHFLSTVVAELTARRVGDRAGRRLGATGNLGGADHYICRRHRRRRAGLVRPVGTRRRRRRAGRLRNTVRCPRPRPELSDPAQRRLLRLGPTGVPAVARSDHRVARAHRQSARRATCRPVPGGHLGRVGRAGGNSRSGGRLAACGGCVERGRRAPRPAGADRGARRTTPLPAGRLPLAGRAPRQRTRRHPRRRHGTR